MHFDVSLAAFRCFNHPKPVHIAPITILLGENSTGKTSFLAALRILLQAFRVPAKEQFNSEPFYLGGYEQIAHFRGGRYGRAKEFEISFHLYEDGQSNLFSDLGPNKPFTSFTLTFVKGRNQPVLSKIDLHDGQISASVNLEKSRPDISVKASGKDLISVDPRRGPPSALLRDDLKYLVFYFEDVLYRRESVGEESSKEERRLLRNLSHIIQRFDNYLGRSVFASAPVRHQPKRVYIPSEISTNSSSEYLLLEMANQKMHLPDEWKITQQKLSKFGVSSGLFNKIDVKRLGKGDGDPFQIQIKNFGPLSNIADVGYGVSQALPLLFPLQVEEKYDAHLIQQPEVHLHPRGQAEFGSLICDLHLQAPENTYVIETHSDFVVDRIRAEVRSGKVRSGDVSILLFQKDGIDVEISQLRVAEDGTIKNQPDDYRDFFLNERARILGL